MKRTYLSVIAASTLILTTSSCASQDIPQDKVPSVVVNALGKIYPTANKVEWQKQKQGYEAEFDSDTTELTVLISAQGTIVQTKRDVAVTEIPEAIQDELNRNYKGQAIDDVELVEKNDQEFYQVELETRLKDTKVVFNNAGQEQKNFTYWD